MNMYVFYDEGKSFKTGSIISETENNIQIISEHGKHIKIKQVNCLFKFDTPDPLALMTEAKNLTKELDAEFLWECSPKNNFKAIDLAEEYFGHRPTNIEYVSVLILLHNSPIYFHKKGTGQYISATEYAISSALIGIEKKKLIEQEQEHLKTQMLNGILPKTIHENAELLVTSPDKQSIQWKALNSACMELQKSPEQLLLSLKTWPNRLILLKKKFISANFPNGLDFPKASNIKKNRNLNLSNNEIYSIDDKNTIEIDDGLSVRELENGEVEVGIHIAAPGLGIEPGSIYDTNARFRASTIYMPSEKIQMQPDAILDEFSLDKGKETPALSLYVIFDRDYNIIKSSSCIELVKLKDNLRTNHLEEEYTASNLDNPEKDVIYSNWIRPLWKIAQKLNSSRQVNRGFSENNSYVDFSIYLEGDTNNPDTIVQIEKRRRDSPINLVVSEFMILANCLWGGLLKKYHIPGIYRSQQPMSRVKVGTIPLPHSGIGVPQYIWSTSPLRRYVDLVNQWQLISIVENEIAAPLFSPFRNRGNELLTIIQEFELRYSVISNFQNEIENYWYIKWLIQNGIKKTIAHVIKDNLIKLIEVPLFANISDMPKNPRGTAMEVEITDIDELNCKLTCKYIQRSESI
ncbi:exoribonuclease II [Candidatus Kinetoplastibacterium blastocrithidii TCC012E]|uniref:Exoribonuclease II n=1 Tax=Candidatus Kinetoplastidibacterium blastocrithidiae TCC012E TaxID=1208922 RepID=M1ME87_9PROT|nr:RNB domain-containing ribonuclease [Candidatus Kinetoplastibacterium blastocrithidii]AFZ83226.1 exoribonuclease II [Candidatus Kinetoplastibacterium blastocrithidii (ex Strigomonas culicis)]AGF50040.1 exoribonuclease II [Candidatus Kinetoplastibacterium blastocrithidii TCC012E]